MTKDFCVLLQPTLDYISINIFSLKKILRLLLSMIWDSYGYFLDNSAQVFS